MSRTAPVAVARLTPEAAATSATVTFPPRRSTASTTRGSMLGQTCWVRKAGVGARPLGETMCQRVDRKWSFDMVWDIPNALNTAESHPITFSFHFTSLQPISFQLELFARPFAEKNTVTIQSTAIILENAAHRRSGWGPPAF